MMDYVPAFILGLIGSFHCAGMCGPLALALPNARPTRSSLLLTRLVYNLGRVVTYCLLGSVCGLLGKTLAIAGVQRWVSITAGALLLLGLFAPRALPVSGALAAYVQTLKSRMAALLRAKTFLSLGLLGLLNGLLPCGLVYVAAAGAAAVGDIPGGMIYMAAFGLGTFPVMFAIGVSARLLPFSMRLKFQRVIPVAVFLLAILLILRGMSLGVPYLSPDLAHGACCGK